MTDCDFFLLLTRICFFFDDDIFSEISATVFKFHDGDFCDNFRSRKLSRSFGLTLCLSVCLSLMSRWSV